MHRTSLIICASSGEGVQLQGAKSQQRGMRRRCHPKDAATSHRSESCPMTRQLDKRPTRSLSFQPPLCGRVGGAKLSMHLGKVCEGLRLNTRGGALTSTSCSAILRHEPAIASMGQRTKASDCRAVTPFLCWGADREAADRMIHTPYRPALRCAIRRSWNRKGFLQGL